MHKFILFLLLTTTLFSIDKEEQSIHIKNADLITSFEDSSLRYTNMIVKYCHGSYQSLREKYFGDSTKGRQLSLPRLPLPNLKHSLEMFLDVARESSTSDEWQAIKTHTEDFYSTDGRTLQRNLFALSIQEDNYIKDIWDSLAYLSGRNSIIQTNLFATEAYSARTFQEGANPKIQRASWITYLTLNFLQKINHGELPEFSEKRYPLCTTQYFSIAGNCRIPDSPLDKMQQNKNTHHFLLLINNNHWKVSIDPSVGIDRNRLYNTINAVYEAAKELPSPPFNMNVLPTQNRDQWAKDRNELQKDEQNSATLKDIEEALFVICLDETNPQTLVESGYCTYKSLNRWPDKPLQIIIHNEGQLSFQLEHTAADASVPSTLLDTLLYWEQLISQQPALLTKSDTEITESLPMFLQRKHCCAQKGFTENFQLPLIDPENDTTYDATKLEWNLNSDLSFLSKKDELEDQFSTLINDFQLATLEFRDFGADVVKEWKVSPDSLIQMALQLTYYKLHQTTTHTYESASTRIFYEGRTETIRSMSQESNQFVYLMNNPKASTVLRKKALLEGINAHVEYKKNAMRGIAFDRHMVGLYAINLYLGKEAHPFFNDYFSHSKFKLSTSQVRMRQSTGGGFWPTEKDGYGVFYVPMPGGINFFVSAQRSCDDTDPDKFSTLLRESLLEIESLF